MNHFDLGMCTHFSQQKGIVELNLQSIKDAGISAIRDEAAWSALERTRGVFSMPERFDSYVKHIAQEGVDVMLILDYANPFYDDGWNAEYNENNFGIVRPDLTPKPAYYVTRDVSALVRHGQYMDRLNTSDEHLWILRFRHDEEDVWAIWSGDNQKRQVILKTTDPGESLLVQQLGHAPMKRRWGYLDWAGSRRNDLKENQLSIVVGHRPYILRGDLGNVSVVDVLLRSTEEVCSQ